MKKKIEVNGENYQKQQAITNRIDALLQKIENDTAHHSTSRYVLEHPAFAELINMGEKIVPYLVHVATQYGASWTIFLLLHKLTNANPIPEEDAGKFQRALMHWLKWYTENEKYQNVDVYYGLVD